MKKFLFAACAATAILCADAARAETTECTEITVIPFVITVQGVYCFKQNLGTAITTGYAIDIQTNNVTIDFNGFKLGGLAAGPSTNAYGVYAVDRQNITLKNGNIRGFRYGIWLDQVDGTSSGHVIEDSLLDNNTYTPLRIEGSGIVVRNNRIVNTDTTPPAPATDSLSGGFALSNGAATEEGFGNFAPQDGTGGTGYGIYGAVLADSVIEDNIISGVVSSGGSVRGIYVTNSSNVHILGNSITHLDAYGSATGIYLNLCAGVTIRDNNLTDGKSATSTAFGVVATPASTHVACVRNVILDFTNAATSGCTTEIGTVQ